MKLTGISQKAFLDRYSLKDKKGKPVEKTPDQMWRRIAKSVAEIEKRTSHIKTPLDVSVMGCVVNAIGEAKSADVAIAFGKGSGLVMKKGEIIAKLSGEALINKFVEEVEFEAKKKL